MSRSGYSDDCENWSLICWRGAVTSAIRGKRGQQALREIAAALDSLPVKELAAESLVTEEGTYCTLGALGRARGIDMSPIDPEDRDTVAQAFGIAEAMAAEVMYLNDEGVDEWKYVDVEIVGPVRRGFPDYGRHRRHVRVPEENVAEKRWRYMRDWVEKQIRHDNASGSSHAS